MTKHLYLICGFHRSGTSLLARCLAVFGIGHNDEYFHLPNIFNQSGYFEDQRVVDLHDDLILSAGLDWWDPAVGQNSLSLNNKSQSVKKIINYLNLLEINDTFFVKDPRAILFVPSWIQAAKTVGISIHPIFIIRNPDDCVASLIARDQLNSDHLFALWTSYHANLQYISKLLKTGLFIRYEKLTNHPLQTLSELQAFLKKSSNQKISDEQKGNLAQSIYSKAYDHKFHKTPARNIAYELYNKICEKRIDGHDDGKYFQSSYDLSTKEYLNRYIDSVRNQAKLFVEFAEVEKKHSILISSHASLVENTSKLRWLLKRLVYVALKKALKYARHNMLPNKKS